MAFLNAQVSFPYFTNIPEDVITNTWHFESTGVTNAVAAITIANRLTTFYTSVYSVSGSAGNHVNWSQGIVKVYDLADPLPRTPIIQTVPVFPTSPAASTIPTEMAIVLSYHAAPVSGVPNGRLRGRVYLGGFAQGVMGAGSASSFPTVGSSIRTQIASAATALKVANTANVEWVQRSTVGLITSSSIQGGWVDNTPDTQRRRGVKATTRNLWT